MRDPTNRRYARLGCYLTAVGFAFTLVLLPLLVIEVPPIEDYPDHLARMWILAKGGNDPFLSHMYAADWHIIPNLAADLFIPPLLSIMPLYWAGRLMLAVTLLLPVIGVISLHRVLHGRLALWPLASCLIAYNIIFFLGFINFLIGLGLALLTAAAWMALRPRRPIAALSLLACGAVAVFFCHAVSLILLAVLVASTQVELLLSLWRGGEDLRRPVAHCMLESLVAFALPAWLYIHSVFGHAQGTIEYASIKLKLTEILAPILNYHPVFDLLAAAFVILGLLVLTWTHLVSATAMTLRIRLALVLLVMLFIVAPFAVKGGAWLDVRFPLMAALLLFAGLDFAFVVPRAGLVVGLAAAALLMVRTALVAQIWHDHEQYLDAIRTLVAQVPAGAKVLVARADPELHPAWWHGVSVDRRLAGFGSTDDYLAPLLLVQRRAFSPLLFADPAQQPVRVLDPYRQLSVQVGELPDYMLLRSTRSSGEQAAKFPYLLDWPEHFDFLLIIDADGAPDLDAVLASDAGVAAKITSQARSNVAALFVIRHPDPLAAAVGGASAPLRRPLNTAWPP